MKALYFDCFSGISGDMALASLIDLGADLSYIEEHLKQLPVDPFEIRVETVMKRGIAAKKLRLYIKGDHQHHGHRRAAEIFDMIDKSELPPRVKRRSRAIFHVIALAEGKIHGIDPGDVHFHEVGAMDSILDIIGVCLALENLDIGEILASPVPTGYGKVRMAHGMYPIPAPATAELLTGIPLADLTVEGELITPTGAGILKALVNEFGPLRSLTMERIGYGAGERDFDHPNVLRAILVQKQHASLSQVDGERIDVQRTGEISATEEFAVAAPIPDHSGENGGSHQDIRD